jgi:hypothetical protein
MIDGAGIMSRSLRVAIEPGRITSQSLRIMIIHGISGFEALEI